MLLAALACYVPVLVKGYDDNTCIDRVPHAFQAGAVSPHYSIWPPAIECTTSSSAKNYPGYEPPSVVKWAMLVSLVGAGIVLIAGLSTSILALRGRHVDT